MKTGFFNVNMSSNTHSEHLNGLKNITSILIYSPNGLPTKEECKYTKCFCEENVWLLVKKIQETSPEKLQFCHPIFISNDNAQIPLWQQSLSSQEDGLVVWDYHVILVYCHEDKSWVYDFDTQLPFPTEFSEYCKKTFKSEESLRPQYHRLFRVLSAESYLKYFSSDRRHMKNDDDTWKKPPPNYPAIQNGEHNLGHYISMKNEERHRGVFGFVINLSVFVEKFSRIRTSRPSFDYMYPPEPTCL